MANAWAGAEHTPKRMFPRRKLTGLSGLGGDIRGQEFVEGRMIKDFLIVTLFPGAMALAAATDLLTMTVPNRLSLALAAGFFVLAPLVGLGWSDIGLHVAAGAAALTLAFVLFSFGWIGGGDAKLFAGTCLWLGPEMALSYALYAALLGGAFALLLLVWRVLPLPALLASQGWIVRLHNRKEGVPYAIALAAAGLLAYPGTPFMAALGH
ncbi:MAG TPA: prepilin peptidase [Methyloceanibacter sp.]|nr:prepilin peptidase [Methyloceanibacter sp.]